MSDLWDKIVSSAPVNKDAAVARDGSGEHFEPDMRLARLRWDAPPPTKPVPDCPSAKGFVGIKFGRLTVVGLYAGEVSKKEGARWVVRCACGAYETRRAKAIRNPINAHDRCSHCEYLERLRRREVHSRSGKWPEDRVPEF